MTNRQRSKSRLAARRYTASLLLFVNSVFKSCFVFIKSKRNVGILFELHHNEYNNIIFDYPCMRGHGVYVYLRFCSSQETVIRMYL